VGAGVNNLYRATHLLHRASKRVIYLDASVQMATASIRVERHPLRLSREVRLNSYNHHALSPWLAETGFLTPLYFHHRENALQAFNMARWMTPEVSKWMLHSPALVLEFNEEHLRKMITLAAETDYGKDLSEWSREALENLTLEFPQLENVPESGYFVRMSGCSLKDADNGNQKPIFSLYDTFLKIISSKRSVTFLLAFLAQEDKIDYNIFFFPYYEELDKLSEWRCFICKDDVVAISQSRFYQNNHDGITDEALLSLVHQSRALWTMVKPELGFDSCIFDCMQRLGRKTSR
jgi:hypothetical protein